MQVAEELCCWLAGRNTGYFGLLQSNFNPLAGPLFDDKAAALMTDCFPIVLPTKSYLNRCIPIIPESVWTRAPRLPAAYSPAALCMSMCLQPSLHCKRLVLTMCAPTRRGSPPRRLLQRPQ